MKTKCPTFNVLKSRVSKLTGLVVTLILLGFVKGEAQPCPLACNDNVQVSVDANCTAEITPDMLLEAPGVGCNYQVVIYDVNNQPLPDDTVRYAHVGQVLKARVTLGANSCWSNITVEDKMPPQVICADPDVVMCNDTSYTITPDQVIENCGIRDTVILSDRFIDYPCDSIYSGVREICRYYVDESGNHSDTCCHQVFFARPALADIEFPGDTTFDCLSFVDADPARTGVPTWNGVPLYPDRGVCEINIDFVDDTIDICPGSYKIIREWLILDWCLPSNNGNPRLSYQVIKVTDENGPVVYCPTTAVEADTFPSDIYTCTGTVLLPEPHVLLPGQPIVDSSAIYIISECSETSYSVRHLPATSPDNCVPDPRLVPNQDYVYYDPALNRWVATDLPAGCNWFYYTFTDECGNSTECTFDIFIEDQTPPNAICDEHTIASLGIDGTTKIFANTFDDQSWDNCGIDTMLVRRMDRGNPCGNNITDYRDHVVFCCNDIGQTRLVEFVVIDEAGNSNTCMVEVEVQDKIRPIVTCPPNITVSCQMDLSDLSVFGTVVNAKFQAPRNPIVINDPYVAYDGPAIDGEYYDNCIASVDTSSRRSIECGRGFIDRTFTITDQSGQTASCTQRITIQDFEPFFMSSRDWPRDYSSTTDCSTGPQTDPDVTGRPNIADIGCGDIFVGYDDQTFNKEPDACLKVLRKWTVIDWCYYDPNATNPDGIWTHTQVIKINNSVPPMITSSCTDRDYDLYGQDCTEEIQLVATADDDCTADEDLRWEWSIDLNEDGLADINGRGSEVIRDFEPGTYEIWWKVKDECDNESDCHYEFTVTDRKNPSPYCRDAVVTVVMEQSLSIEVWASDLNIASEDNCTPQEDLEYYFFHNGQYVTARTFDCSHLGRNVVRMYVRDEAGNEDYCEVEIEIQDPNNLCGTNGFVSVGGALQARNGEYIQDVQVNITNMGSQSSQNTMTDNRGKFLFSHVSKNGSYRLSAEKNDDILNGVDIKDLLLIQRYLLGMEPFVSPLQVIAADANNSQEITAADIAAIRKVILGKESQFAGGQQSYRFVNGGETFSDIDYPWPFEETMEYHDINRDQMSSNFDAVKIGDVNGDVVGLKGSQTRSKDIISVMVDDQRLLENEMQEVQVKFDGETMANSMQVSLKVQPGVQIVGVESGQMNICEECYHLVDSQMNITWYSIDPMIFSEEDAIFTLLVESSTDVNLSEVLSIHVTGTPSILYADLVDEGANIELRFNEKDEVVGQIELYQNRPNPFTASTAIGFDLPSAQNVKLTVFDVTGRVLKVLEGHFDKGYHEFMITGEELNVEGVLYYQLTAGSFSSTRKMLIAR